MFLLLGHNFLGCRGRSCFDRFLGNGPVPVGYGLCPSVPVEKGPQREGKMPEEKCASCQDKRSEEEKNSSPVEQGKGDRQDGFAGTSAGGVGGRERVPDKQGKKGAQGDKQKGSAQGKGYGEGSPPESSVGFCRQEKREEQGGEPQKAVGQIGKARSRHPEKIMGVGAAASGEKGGIIGGGREKGPSNKNGKGSQKKGGQGKVAIPARGAGGGIPVGGLRIAHGISSRG